MYRRAKMRANINGTLFTIEKEDVIIPEVCPILKIPFSFDDRELTPSIDRKINELGYVKGNVFVISGRANRLKADATVDELEKILQYMKSTI